MTQDREKTEELTPSSRFAFVDEQKASGATYTPVEFAQFVARAALQSLAIPNSGPIKILDPAVGDGALLAAVLQGLPPDLLHRVELTGFDTSASAIQAAAKRLAAWQVGSLNLQEQDFLVHLLEDYGQQDLLAASDPERYDLIVANPPYVRTQVLGAEAAQALGRRFGLTGRVDLYYPFLLGLSQALAPNGIAAVITSNRFMTTKSGQAVRSALLRNYELLHVWDMGDTKLFEAAVLPAVILAKPTDAQAQRPSKAIPFTTIYEDSADPTHNVDSALRAVALLKDGVFGLPNGLRFKVRHGVLDNGGEPEGVWRIGTAASDGWLETVASHTWAPFKSIGKIRVGVKSTADKVFVRSDWDELPDGRPELVRPLLTRYMARQFKAKSPDKASQRKEILYPHEATTLGRRAVDLDRFPISRQYLEQHRKVLEARTYVIEAGRNWYELWVPQDPAAWAAPKLVFPDISEEPTFWMDLGGGVVNGECYWLKADDARNTDLLWLALAVANSSFIKAFYDHRFNNKLYAGRRRFITQYVEQFPLPDPQLEASKAIVQLTKQIFDAMPDPACQKLVDALDVLVWNVFGLDREEVPR